MINVNSFAPSFSLPANDGKTYCLEDFKGKKIILYFYPKDSTAGCTKEAIGFAESNDAFTSNNTVVIGVSKDSVASHVKFAQKYSLPFILLSDSELNTIKAYDVWKEKKMCGKVSMGVVRTTFIIDENGKIEKVFENVKADGHAEKVREYLGF